MAEKKEKTTKTAKKAKPKAKKAAVKKPTKKTDTAKKTKKTVKKKQKKKDYAYETGKRKKAVARAMVKLAKGGKGKVTINSKPLDIWGTDMLRLLVKEPLMIAGDEAEKFDIKIIAQGGGINAQAEASRIAIARGLVKMMEDKGLKEKYLSYDRNLIVFDSRRTEPHKPSRSKKGARRHKQRSKR